MRANGTIAWVDGPGIHVIDGLPLVALSCTFIPARLDDNRFLRDTDYRTQLMGLPEPLRSKLLNGDFLAGRADAPSQVIPWAWIEAAQKDWTPDGARGLKMTTLGVDVAQGGADETVLVASARHLVRDAGAAAAASTPATARRSPPWSSR